MMFPLGYYARFMNGITMDSSIKLSGRLLIAPPPFPDENLLGYLVRLTDANGYDSQQDLLQLITGRPFYPAKPKKYYSFLEGENLQQFCYLTGLHRAVIDQIEKRRSLINKAADLISLKFCAECLKEKPYYRLVWDDFFYCACHKHKTILIDVCPACKEKFQWRSNRISYCQCGYDIRNSSRRAASDEAVSACNMISELCGLGFSDNKQVLSSEWNAKNLTEFGEVLTMMTEIRADVLDITPLYLATKNDLRHELISEAYKLMQFWPHKFNKFILSQPHSTYEKMVSCWSRFRWSEKGSLKIVVETWRGLIEQRWLNEASLEGIVIKNLFQSAFGRAEVLTKQRSPNEKRSGDPVIKELFRSLFGGDGK